MRENTYSSIKPGQVWRDTEGKPIQAHGFSVMYKDGTYYWFGENKELTRSIGKIWTWGIRCYTSKDLYNWEDKGLIVKPEPDDLQHPMHPNHCIDRPHILYCPKTGKYVMWIKIMGGLVSQFMCIMQADDILGPYEIVRKYYHPLGMDTGDFTLVQDGEKAYIMFERPHFEMIVADLTDDYTAVTGNYSEHFQNLYPPFTREAPTYFTKDGKKYLYTSGTTGYSPNPSNVVRFDDFHGKYENLGYPHQGDKTNTSFSSQITCVLKVPGTDLYIAMADRWEPGPKSAWLQKMTSNHYARMFRNYKPDTSPKETTRLSDKQAIHMNNTKKSTYVWLPIKWENGVPNIYWYDEWKIEDFIK